MKKNVTVPALAALFAFTSAAQAQDGSDKSALIKEYSDRYELLVSRLGPAGVGIETLLDKWEAADSSDVEMMRAKFEYYFAKSQKEEVVAKDAKKFLGAGPVLTLKDSIGNNVNYFQETFFDDSLYMISVRYADKAIASAPERLDLRFYKAASLIAYEKDSPDMAIVYIGKLVDEYYANDREWTYPGVEVDENFFPDALQEYCYAFFKIGTPVSYSAFKTLSEKMLGFCPGNTVYMSNIGSYYLVAESDYKSALKYYNKVLKIKPDDYTAIKNCVLIARKQKNEKLEKKYLPMLIKYGSQSERLAAEARLKSL